MPSITFEWPEDGIKEVINSEQMWSLSAFKKLNLNEAVVADFSPHIDTNLGVFKNLIVSNIMVNKNTCSFKYFDEMLQKSKIYQDMIIRIRPMSRQQHLFELNF
jgi:hypothetical protein